MFLALLASVTALLAVLLQKLELPQKQVRLLTYFLVFLFIVFMVMAFITEKPFKVKGKITKPVNGSIYENIFTAFPKEVMKEYLKETIELYRTDIPVMTEKIYNRNKERLYEQE